MVETERVWIAKPLTEVFEDIRKDVAGHLKKKYNLAEITVPTTLSSQILAAKYKGRKEIQFRIRKVGLNRGVLEFY